MLIPRHRADQAQKLVKQKSRVLGPGACFRMKLDPEKRPITGTNPFVGAVIDVDKPGFPFRGQGLLVHGVTMVLTGDVATPRNEILDRLINAPMPIGQFIGVAAGGQRQQLIPQTDAKDWLGVVIQKLLSCSTKAPRCIVDPENETVV